MTKRGRKYVNRLGMIVVGVCVLFFFLSSLATCKADDGLEIGFGESFQATMMISARQEIYPKWGVTGGYLFDPNPDYRFDTKKKHWSAFLIAIDRRFYAPDDIGFATFGASYISEETEFTGTHYNFYLGLGLKIRDDVTLEWRHISHGTCLGIRTDSPNNGMDIVNFSWRF